jgi:hypothetical protein
MQLRKKPDANKLCQAFFAEFGAGDEARTRDLNLGKVALYQLSYSRLVFTKNVVFSENQNYITTTRLHVKSTPSFI